MELICIDFTSNTYGPMSDFFLHVSSSNTPKMQEWHLALRHILCDLFEAKLFCCLS